MLFNNSTTGYDLQAFSILVTFNPRFRKKIKSHSKKKWSSRIFQLEKEFAKIVSIVPNFKQKEWHRIKIREMKSQHVLLHGLSSTEHLLSVLCNNEACSNHSQAAAELELPTAGVINTMLVPKLLSFNSL